MLKKDEAQHIRNSVAQIASMSLDVGTILPSASDKDWKKAEGSVMAVIDVLSSYLHSITEKES